jgi:hypothetical protein
MMWGAIYGRLYVTGLWATGVTQVAAGDNHSAALGVGGGQGHTLVHFSAQPEPFLTQSTP